MIIISALLLDVLSREGVFHAPSLPEPGPEPRGWPLTSRGLLRRSCRRRVNHLSTRGVTKAVYVTFVSRKTSMYSISCEFTRLFVSLLFIFS